jgi:general secretion pathway protein G
MKSQKYIDALLTKKAKGYSLIEIMLVLSIVMGLMVGVVQIYTRVKANMKKSSTQSLLLQVENGINEFKNDVGRYPHTLEELVSGPSDAQEKRRWSNNYIQDKNAIVDGSIKDSYGNDLQYAFNKETSKFNLFSWGPEGEGAEFGQIVLEK